MKAQTLIIPQKGLVVRDPETMEALPEEGKAVHLTTYWHRRIKDGDVTVGKQTTSKTKGK